MSEAASDRSDATAVLVVDSEVLVRMAIAAYLRDCGYKVVEAASGDEAVVVLGQPELLFDAVLAEIALPGEMDGFTLARWARERRPGLEVLLAGTPARAADQAADLCDKGPRLARPYEPQAVLDRIRRLLAARDRSGEASTG